MVVDVDPVTTPPFALIKLKYEASALVFAVDAEVLEMYDFSTDTVPVMIPPRLPRYMAGRIKSQI